MQDSIVNCVILILVFAFILYIVCNSNLKLNKLTVRGRERFEQTPESTPVPTLCHVTRQEYNDLGTEWQNYLDSPSPETLQSGYATKVGELSTKINTQMGNCFDSDKTVNALSGGDCPNCQYAKNLFRHLDLDANHDLGFGAMNSYCPNSLNAPGAQVCLRNLKRSTTGIGQLSNQHTQELIDELSEENRRLSDNAVSMKLKIDDKLDRDYVKSYLTYHKNFQNSLDNYRVGNGQMEEVIGNMKPPVIDMGGINSVNDSGVNDDQSNDPNVLSHLFGNYKYDSDHTMAMLLTDGISEQLIYAVMDATITISSSGISIINHSQTAPKNVAYSFGTITEIPNIKSSEKAYSCEYSEMRMEFHPAGEQLFFKEGNRSYYDLLIKQ